MYCKANLCFYNQNRGKEACEFSTKHSVTQFELILGKDYNNLTCTCTSIMKLSLQTKKF